MYSGARRRAQNEEYQYKYAGLNMSNKYLEKIAGMSLGPIGRNAVRGAAIGSVSGAIVGGKDNRIKGALAGAAAGGVAGSVFGRAMKPKTSHIFDASSPVGRDAKLINPKMVA
jgi:outer membrane lipoprotein SlyB